MTKSFLDNFCTVTSAAEVHPTYALWAGLISLSSLMGRRVNIDMGTFIINPHLYVVFVAAPGGRKSSSMDFAGRYLEEMDVPVASDCTTKESLVTSIAAQETVFVPPNGETIFTYSPLTILATELSEFVGPSKESMVSFLTTLYDKRGDYKNGTIKRGLDHLVNPCLNMLGCATPAWITSRLRDDIISGGFSRRCIFVYELERPGRIAFPELTDEHHTAWRACLDWGQTLKSVHGKFTWEPAARSFFKDWYENLEIPNDPFTEGYYSSKHVQLLKVAQLCALSESTQLLLEKRHLEAGLALLELSEQNLSRVFSGVSQAKLQVNSNKIVDFLRQAGGHLGEKQIYSIMLATHRDTDIAMMIEQAIKQNLILRKEIVNSRTGVKINTLFTPEGLEKLQREIQHASNSRS